MTYKPENEERETESLYRVIIETGQIRTLALSLHRITCTFARIISLPGIPGGSDGRKQNNPQRPGC
jgi:hypothetical protein